MGESAAFGPLINLYKRQLFSYFFKLIGDRVIAEDLFQETLIKVWRGLPSYSEKSKFSSWLFAIAHNTAMDSLRAKHRNKIFSNNEEPDQFIGVSDPHQEFLNSETTEIVSKAVDMLSPKQKEVFLLRVNGELSFKEIANLTGESLNTVLSHMHYSVQKLRKILRFENAR